jgi:hypothetical protein
MRVGSVTETITVSGETPIVDVQTVRRQTVLDPECQQTRSSYAHRFVQPGSEQSRKGAA